MNALVSLPIATRRVYRLAFGMGLATLISYALMPDFASIFILLVLFIMIPPMPPPNAKALLKLLLILIISTSWGIFLGLTLSLIPTIGLILFGIGMVFTIGLGLKKPELGIVSMLFIVGQTIVAAMSLTSASLGIMMMVMMLGGFIFAFFMAWLSHLFLLRENTVENFVQPVQSNSKWIPIRATIIMLPPFLMVLQDLFFIPLLIKGSLLAQQIDKRSVKQQVIELMLATLVGVTVTIILWNVLSFWPNLIFFSLCLTLTVYLLACPLYKVWKSGYDFAFWQNALVTLIILIGPTVQDPVFSDDIQSKMWVRIGLFFSISLYSIMAVNILDTLYTLWRNNKKTKTQWTT